jgi:hypothetical protein
MRFQDDGRTPAWRAWRTEPHRRNGIAARIQRLSFLQIWLLALAAVALPPTVLLITLIGLGMYDGAVRVLGGG